MAPPAKPGAGAGAGAGHASPAGAAALQPIIGPPAYGGCPLVGRDEAIAGVLTALRAGRRQVWLVGSAGVGKSRMAARIARRHGPAPVWAAVQDTHGAGGLGRALLDALGVPVDGPVAPRAVQRALVARGPGLLVIDGAGHIAAAVSAAITRWLEAIPGLQIIVTSRVGSPLDATVERHIGPLSTAIDGGGSSPAGRMLIACARHLHPNLPPPPAATAERIAALLDGLPQALMLAANRLALMSPADLVDRIERHGRVRGVGRALSSLIEDMLACLTPAERVALDVLAIFAEGFAADAAADLIGETTAGAADGIATLQRLHQRGLIEDRAAGEGRRLRLLGCVSEPVEAALEPERRRTLTHAHARWFAERAAQQHAQVHRCVDGRCRRWFAAESANLHRALETALAADAAGGIADVAWSLAQSFGAQAIGWSGGAIDVSRFAALPARPGSAVGWLAVGHALARRGRLDEADDAFWRAEQHAAGQRVVRARALEGHASVAGRRGHAEQALRQCGAALALLTEDADCRWRGWTLATRALSASDVHSPAAAISDLSEAIPLLERAGDHYGAAVQRANLGLMCLRAGDSRAAVTHMQRASAVTTRCAAMRVALYIDSNLAGAYFDSGDIEACLAQHARIDPTIERLGEPRLLAAHRLGHGVALWAHGDPGSARQCFESALVASLDGHDPRFEVDARGWLLALDVAEGSAEAAGARLDALQWPAVDGQRIWPLYRQALDGWIALAGWRAELVAGRLQGVRQRIKRAHGLWSALSRAHDPLPIPVRRLGRQLASTIEAMTATLEVPLELPSQPDVLVVEPGCMGVWSPTGGYVDLRRRRVSRLLLRALVDARLAHPGEGLDLDTLWAAGWGGQRIAEASRKNRIYVAVADLRKRGVGDLLQRCTEGYRLDPGTPVRRLGSE